MPENFKYVGAIKLALPDAKIIHCKRSAPDNCLSILKCYFAGGRHEFAYNQESLAHFYKLYLDLMDHWKKVLPGAIYEVQYEELVADQEAETRSLLSYIGADWNDACLNFHKTKRAVQTASAGQVRRPIYKDSVQLWKRYEKQLQPLLTALG